MTSVPIPITPRSISTQTSVVHLEYDLEVLPPKPGPSWTRFVCLSDTHGRTFEVPDGDVLLHSGDLTNLGLLEEFETMVDWLCSLPHKVKVIIAGNHDVTLHSGWYDTAYKKFHKIQGRQEVGPILELLNSPRARAAGLIYLQDASYEFQPRPDGRAWGVWGSPWSPYFYDWAFNYQRHGGQALLSRFPKTDILLTHGPPFGICDMTSREESVGCQDLRARLPHLRPRLHVFGHVHEGRGAHIHSWGSGPDDDSDDENPGDENTEAAATDPAFGALSGIDGGDQTVFVNPAAWPSGRATWRDGQKVPFGGPGVQPIVVDLLD